PEVPVFSQSQRCSGLFKHRTAQRCSASRRTTSLQCDHGETGRPSPSRRLTWIGKKTRTPFQPQPDQSDFIVVGFRGQEGGSMKSLFTARAVFYRFAVLYASGLLYAVIAAPAVSAQESVNNASISGRVTDATGAVVEGAHVAARQIDTNLASMANTDREGRFRFPYLRVGQYEIKVHHQGFADLARSLTLT